MGRLAQQESPPGAALSTERANRSRVTVFEFAGRYGVKRIEPKVLSVVLLVYLAIFAYRLSAPAYGYQYSAQAASFLLGRADILADWNGVTACTGDSPVHCDVTLRDGKTFLPVPPLPAVIAIPLVFLFGVRSYESVLPAVFGAINLLLVFRLCRRMGCSHQVGAWLIVLFGFGSLYFYAVAAAGNWLFSHVLAATWTLLLLLEVVGEGRGWVLGGGVGLVSLTRPSTALLIVLALAVPWAKRKAGRVFCLHALLVLLGLAPFIAFWLWYNAIRFGNPMDMGYASITVPDCIGAPLRSGGIFGLEHVARNAYVMLVLGPQPVTGASQMAGNCSSVASLAGVADSQLVFPFIRPSEWGMGLIWTTPALLFALRGFVRDRLIAVCWMTVCLLAAIGLAYYSTGWQQFGYRYSLDYTPVLILILARRLKDGIPNGFKVAVLVSVAVEIWGVWLMGLTAAPGVPTIVQTTGSVLPGLDAAVADLGIFGR